MRAWERSAPWFRRFSMRLGLEKKLVLCFIAVLSGALMFTCWTFARETHARLSDIMAEQARQVATALSLSAEKAYRASDWPELNRRGHELIKSRNILYVGYLDGNGRAKSLASRDPDFALANLTFNAQTLMQPARGSSATFGEHLQVVMPILSSPGPGEDRTGPRLLGYVAVGVSQAREEAQMRAIQYLIAGVACVMFIVLTPLAMLLIHRVFLPIRKLVSVTKQITAGDLNARVEIHRPDVIGDLARNFDEMVQKVKQQQQDLEAANDDLETKVEQRTTQLAAANTRLSAEIKEKEEFLRTVSHDLNAPLRNIAGMASMLLMKYRASFDEDIVHRLERIKSNVAMETDLIAELLELSRIKTRRQKMERVDVEAVIGDVRALFENDLRAKSIELKNDTPLPQLQGERLRIRQIFQNLIDNAIKYMGHGIVREIHVGCVMHADEAEFYVRDTGMGIDPEDLDRVFFVFRRGRNTHSHNISGKGVGLASVKSIVETYDGRIWVASKRGFGSTFRFTISSKFLPGNDQPRVAA